MRKVSEKANGLPGRMRIEVDGVDNTDNTDDTDNTDKTDDSGRAPEAWPEEELEV